MANNSTEPSWASLRQPTYYDQVRAVSNVKATTTASKVADMCKNPLKYSNAVQQIYFRQVNPAALQSPLKVAMGDITSTALRYSGAAGLWG